MGKRLYFIVALLLALSVVACGSYDGSDDGPAGNVASPSSEPSSFPVAVQGTSGQVTIDERPERIVSLSPTATETLFAIGAGRQVVAVDNQSDYPKNAPKTTLSGFTPNVEAIASYRPDLVVISFDTKGLARSLRRLKIKVVHHDGAKTLKGAYTQIRQLGLVTGNAARATQLIKDMRAKIDRIVEASTDRARGLSVYDELDAELRERVDFKSQ